LPLFNLSLWSAKYQRFLRNKAFFHLTELCELFDDPAYLIITRVPFSFATANAAALITKDRTSPLHRN
jgi:hypothetical protein